jgi:hypothetical protein
VEWIDAASLLVTLGDLKEIWRFRDLLYLLIWRDVKVRYKQTALGAAWAVLQPLLMMIVFNAALLNEDGDPTNFIPLGGLFHVRLTLETEYSIQYPAVTIGIDDTMGQRLLSLVTPLSHAVVERIEGRCTIDCRAPQPLVHWRNISTS